MGDSRDGVRLVELAPLADAALVPHAVAAALGVREVAGQPLADAVADSVGPKRLLLVLDNCEHLLEACARLADALLRACPRLQVLATSREGLGVPGETRWPVPPLSVPPAGALPVARLAESEAVRLFTERAASLSPGFTLTEANAAAVAEVCRRLDGLPLAIELAAARVRALSVEQIAARLDGRLRLLTSGRRAAPPHQQTLRASLDWSYELLAEPERRLLGRLAVFAGGWTLEAAEAVCPARALGRAPSPASESPESRPLAPEDVLDALAGLVDKSLVSLVVGSDDGGGAGGESRYGLLETVRQYAHERLEASGEAEDARQRHAAYYLALAEAAEPRLAGPDPLASLARLESEHDNLRQALRWCVAHGASVQGLRLGGALRQFWLARGLVAEGRAHLEAMLALPGVPGVAGLPVTLEGAALAAARAKALSAAAMLTYRLGDSAAARALGEAASDAAWAEGQAMTLEQAIAYALADAPAAV